MDDGFYQIQATCKHGCGDHQPGEWRKSRNLRGIKDQDVAERAMDAHAEEYPRSKPYRLVWIRPPYMVDEALIVLKEIPA